jgi:hypothetical protein
MKATRGDDLPDHLEVLGGYLGSGEKRHAGDIPARTRQAGDESLAYGVRACEHDDRYRRGRGPARPRHCGGPGHDQIDVEQQKLAGKSGDSVDFAVGKSCFDNDVLTVNPAEFGHCLAKGNEHVPAGDRAVERQISDPGQFRRQLGLGGERCGKKCTDGYQEIPALDAVHAFPSLERQPEGIRLRDSAGRCGQSNGRYQRNHCTTAVGRSETPTCTT